MKTASAILGLALALAACATPRRTPDAAANQKSMLDSAVAMVGQPYRYGGATPGGFDCSGLVVYAGRHGGLRLPRTAEEQLHVGIPIARRDLRAGDLVFLHLAHQELHVGIAIDGSRFVHAPSSGGHVRIDSIEASFYSRRFFAARRVIAAAPATTHSG